MHSPLLSLIVLDNFPEELPEEAPRLESYLPTSGQVQTLVTTRRKDLDRHPALTLDYLSPEDALALLNSGPRQFGAEAEGLLTLLGGLPLPIELTRGYLNRRRDATPAALVEEMQRAGEMPVLAEFAKQYGDELPSRHELDVAATFEMSRQLLEDGERRTLAAIAELAPYPVPRRLLRAILELPQGTLLEDPLQQALAELERLSLVDLDEDQEPSVHRLLRSFVRHVNPDRSRLRERVVGAVRAEIGRTGDDSDQAAYRELEAVLPHAEEVARDDSYADQQLSSFLLDRVGTHHWKHGRHRLAEAAMRQALALDEASYEAGHPEIATRQSNLALVLKALGELEEARDLLRQALASDEASYEAGHPEIATRQSNLALVLKDLGEPAEARDLLRQALASAEASFEPGHPEIAIDQSNLAAVLKDLGELEEARDLLRQALASDEASFEPGHPSIATRQSNLAVVLKDLGELEEARDLLRQVLASFQVSYEAGHPSIATSQSNLAAVLQDLGELEEARDLLRQALASDEASYEPGHPSIARSQSNLAMVLKALGELAEARDLLRQAHQALHEKFGPEHPSTKTVLNNLRGVEGQAAGEG